MKESKENFTFLHLERVYKDFLASLLFHDTRSGVLTNLDGHGSLHSGWVGCNHIHEENR